MTAADTSSDLRSTPLFALHQKLGARMVPFAGYAMPVQYPQGLMAEHLHTRKAAGLFDTAAKAITQVGLRTLAVKNGTGVAEPTADYHIDASDVDIDRLFEDLGIRIPSTAAAATDGTQDAYVRGYAYIPANYDPANGIVFAKVGAAIFLERKKILGQPSCIEPVKKIDIAASCKT